MSKLLSRCALLWLLLASLLHAASAPVVIWKLDDLRAGSATPFPPAWAKLVEFAERERIPVSIGIITTSLDNAPPEYVAEIRRLHASGLVEFWNHGWLYARPRPSCGHLRVQRHLV